MRGLNSASFRHAWHALYDASNPAHRADRWSVDGVAWVKERHVYWGDAVSFQVETHRLSHAAPKGGWTLLVVIERWWGPDRARAVREVEWAKMLEGSAEKALAWMRRQGAGR
ncbi:MAG TPA: hypothetical protein VMF53_09675 [Alphaproteobacteria bacterium]|nr:hypothetical protein [Alphaproteobacteria bacterium]